MRVMDVLIRVPTTMAALALLAAPLASPLAAQSIDTTSTTRMVTVEGRTMRVRHAGLERRTPGAPVVVFEAGATNSLDVWASVFPAVARLAPAVAYDRAGLGQSEWDGQSPTPRHIATRLRAMLREIGAPPPYILVGFSWGGSLARYFAGYHPDEVAGIVYVDPGPIVTQSIADELAPFEAIGAGRAGYDAFWAGYAGIYERASAPARAEFEVFRSLVRREPAERDLRPQPDVPVAMVIAAKPFPNPLQLPYDAGQHFQADLRHRIARLQEWALASPRGTIVISNTTTHVIPREEPELVVWAVQRVLSGIGRGR